jgi:Tol biopolymer transport system component
MVLGHAAQLSSPSGIQDPAWSPDGRRLATSTFDRIWISGPDGRGGRGLRADSTAVERDPAWSPDGRRIAFAADSGKGFDLFVAGADGKDVRRLTEAEGDDRWPSWTRDGRIVFSRRANPFDAWRLFAVHETGSDATPLMDDASGDDEREGRVSPDGKRIAYVSDRDSQDGDVDLWVADLDVAERGRVQRTRITRVRGREGYPVWAPDSSRIAYFAQREGRGSVWVASTETSTGASAVRDGSLAASPILVSRRGGAPAWSPDGRTIAIAELPPADPAYNGNPLRNDVEPPPLFAAEGFSLWMVDAPVPVDAGARQVAGPKPASRHLVAAFDRVWETLRGLYYSSGPSADEWAGLKD